MLTLIIACQFNYDLENKNNKETKNNQIKDIELFENPIFSTELDLDIEQITSTIYVSENERYLKYSKIIRSDSSIYIATINRHELNSHDNIINIINPIYSSDSVMLSSSISRSIEDDNSGILYGSIQNMYAFDINSDSIDEIILMPSYLYSPLEFDVLILNQNETTISESILLQITTTSKSLDQYFYPITATSAFLSDDDSTNFVIGTGSVYLLSGLLASPWVQPVLLTLSPELGRKDLGGALDHADINADGADDLLIASDFGAAYIVNGPITSSFSMTEADFSLKTDDPSFPLAVRDIDHADLNDDGYDDFIIGDRASYYAGGAAYVFLGPLSGERMATSADATFYHRMQLALAGEHLCTGDVNMDGVSDLLISAWNNTTEQRWAGEVVAITGFVSGVSEMHDIGTTLQGEEIDDGFGFDCAVADLDDNGFNDILINAPGNTTHGGGAIYRINDGLP